MRYCDFCGRWFRNKQSCRAHLRFCPEYKKEKERREAEASGGYDYSEIESDNYLDIDLSVDLSVPMDDDI